MRRDDAVEVVGILDAERAGELQHELDRHRDDALWLDAHRAQILKTHPDQWIAVYNQQVIACSEDLRDLVNQLNEIDGAREHAVIEFMSEQEIELIVHSA